MHRQRLARVGSLDQPLATAPDEVRFWAKVDKDGPVPAHRPDLGPCWPWTAGVCTHTGYANIYWLGRTQSAHRIAYTLLVGEIEPALTIDHLCLFRSCVNPKHMEVVTQAENNRRITVTEESRLARSIAGRKGAEVMHARRRARAASSPSS